MGSIFIITLSACAIQHHGPGWYHVDGITCFPLLVHFSIMGLDASRVRQPPPPAKQKQYPDLLVPMFKV